VVAAGQNPPPLTQDDLSVAGIPYRASTALIDSLLGSPDSVHGATWYYKSRSLQLSMNGSHGDLRLSQVHLVGPGPSTARGLRVGDSIAKALALYGKSCFEPEYLFCMSDGPDDQRGIWLMVDSAKVSETTLGEVYDNE